MSATGSSHDESREALRARIATLEEEILEAARLANKEKALAQERAYWLDRWEVDHDAFTRHPVLRAVRKVLAWLPRDSSR